MPRKTKAIPANRAEWTFGEALYWHFFVFGTRPTGRPTDGSGTLWNPKEAAGTIGITIRAFWNWIDDRHLPYDTTAAEKVLFGASKFYDEARSELRRLLTKARQPNSARGQSGTGKTPAVAISQIVDIYTTPFEQDDVDGPLDDADKRSLVPFLSEKIGKTGQQGSGDTGFFRNPPGGGLPAGASPKEPGTTPRSGRRAMAFALAGAMLVLGGYGVKQFLDQRKEDPSTAPSRDPPSEPQSIPKPNPAPPSPVQAGTPQPSPLPTVAPATPDAGDTEAKRREEEQRLARQKATLDAIEQERLKKQAAASDLNAKLKAMAASDGDLCQQKLEGLQIPGVTLKCDTLIPFGKLLKGGVGVSQGASSLGDCAARCRKAPDCVAFSFDAGVENVTNRSCYLTGSIPSYSNNATNWIAGVFDSRLNP